MSHLRLQASPEALEEALKTLPSTVDKMYDLTIMRSSRPDLMILALTWTFSAIHSLTPEELCHAVAWSQKSTERLTEKKVASVEMLLSSCGGLLTVTPKRSDYYGPYISFIRRFLLPDLLVHFSCLHSYGQTTLLLSTWRRFSMESTDSPMSTILRSHSRLIM